MEKIKKEKSMVKFNTKNQNRFLMVKQTNTDAQSYSKIRKKS